MRPLLRASCFSVRLYERSPYMSHASTSDPGTSACSQWPCCQACKEYFEKFRRYVYVTPKSYLSFIDGFRSLYSRKLNEAGPQHHFPVLSPDCLPIMYRCTRTHSPHPPPWLYIGSLCCYTIATLKMLTPSYDKVRQGA